VERGPWFSGLLRIDCLQIGFFKKFSVGEMMLLYSNYALLPGWGELLDLLLISRNDRELSFVGEDIRILHHLSP